MPISTPLCPATSAGVEHISAFARRFTEPRAREQELTMSESASVPRLDRREFLKVGASVGGLVLSVGIPSLLRPGSAAAAQQPSGFAPNAFIRVDRAGAVTLVMPMVEMGQGVYTALPMLVAEELEVDLEQVRLEHAPPDDALYANAILHVQTTGLSSSVRAFWTPLRQAGAVARSLIVSAAAKKWGVDPGSCRARRGVVYDAATARHLRYGELVDAAAALPIPAPDSVALKQPKDFTLIGTPGKRLDSADKVNGKAQFGIHAQIPGMNVAAIAISPAFGGSVRSVNEAAARAVSGVRQVVRIEGAVAVVADHTWAAKKGLKAAAVEWDDGPNAAVGSADILRQLQEQSMRPGAVARNQGDAQKALAGA